MEPGILALILSFSLFAGVLVSGSCVPRSGCSLALLNFELSPEQNASAAVLDNIFTRFNTDSQHASGFNSNISPDRVLIPFDCRCLRGALQHDFIYQVAPEDTTLFTIAQDKFQGLTKHEWIEQATPLSDASSIFAGLNIKAPVNCSCGNPDVSTSFGLFVTYVVQPGDTIANITQKFGLSTEAQQALPLFNPATNFQDLFADSIIFVPASVNGTYPSYTSNDDSGGGIDTSVIIGVSVGATLAFLMAAVLGIGYFIYKRKHLSGVKNANLPSPISSSNAISAPKSGRATPSASGVLKSTISSASVRSAISDIALEKSVEFSYNELAAATNNFNETNKIGQGGYGSVYYGYFRDQKLAVKRMNMQATKEFLAELKVLSRVHHSNLVQLVGYCTVDSLFLVYEFVDNGTLSQHLHSSTRPPLSWASRVQIALDAARGLEYIHEHTKPTYIHRDVKSTNILIDRNFHAKVADFGLTKLTETGIMSMSLTHQTRLVGTFGYMSPEYARFGDVSPFLDVYSFGVVLFEILSAKEAIIKTLSGFLPQKDEQKGLVTLFEDVLQDPKGKEKLRELVDPRLGNNYPLEAAWSLAVLAGACTKENPDLRPNMRTVVVALMTLMSSGGSEAGASWH